MAPTNGPMGCRMPPSTAMIRTLISQLVPTDPGEISPLYQTSSTPPTAAMSPATAYAATRCAVTWKPSALMRRGLSRMPWRATPKGARTRYATARYPASAHASAR